MAAETLFQSQAKEQKLFSHCLAERPQLPSTYYTDFTRTEPQSIKNPQINIFTLFDVYYLILDLSYVL